MTIISPCTGVCKLDETSGWCLGCGRSGDEIAEWRAQPDPWRDHVWKQIPERLNQLGVAFHRLPWTTDYIKEFVSESCQKGTWVMGVVGAVAEFSDAPGTRIDVTVQGDELTAKTPDAALRMIINDDIRALSFDTPGVAGKPRIVLAVKRERGRLPVAEEITNLGIDDSALLDEPNAQLFDLGLGRKEARFCVRVKEGAARDTVTAAIGSQFTKALDQIGGTLISESPTRVVETSLGRIEVQGKILMPGATSPPGSHTHLLPEYLATKRAMPTGMDLPRAYLPGAIFYHKG